jgi:DNA-binding beta-propeller fold protein YncE
LKLHSSKANAGKPAAGAKAPSDRICWIGAAGLLLVLATTCTVFGARSESAPKENIEGIRTANRTVLVGPKGDPFDMPTDVAVGRKGCAYVLDGVHHRVVVYDAEGQFRFQFGGRGSEPGQLLFPLGIATAPDGQIYVADSGNHRFQVFAADGTPLEAVSLPRTKSSVPPDPTDVVVDSIRQRLYIADNDNHHVLVYDLTSRDFESVWGGPGQDQRQFRFPFLMDISTQGYLLVVEPINTRVQVLNSSGKFVNFIGGWGVRPGRLFRPKGVAISDGRVFVTDSYLGSVQVFDMSGSFLGVLADTKGTPIKFITPAGVAIDPRRKRLYVVELKAHRLCRLDLE